MTEADWNASDDPASMLAFVTDWHGYPSAVFQGASARKIRLLAVACARQVWELLTDDSPCPQCEYRKSFGVGFAGSYGCDVCSGTDRINRSLRALDVAERFADGLATENELADAYFAAAGAGVGNRSEPFAEDLAWRCAGPIAALTENNGLPRWFSVSTKLAASQAALLREVFGNPWRPRTAQRYWSWKCEKCGQWGHWDNEPKDIAWTPFCKPSCGGKIIITEPARWLTSTVLDLARTIYDERRFEDMPILWDALADAGCTDEAIRRHCMGEEPCWTLGPDHDDICRGGRIQSPNAQFTRQHEDCNGTGWRPLRGPHVRGCFLLDLILGKE